MNHRVLVAGCLFALAMAAAQGAERLAAKTGEWEMTVTTKVDGSVIPPDLLAKIPPDKRAQLEQAIAARAGANAKPRVTRTCMTEADLEKGAFTPPDSSCKVTTISRTPTHQEMSVECERDGRKSTGHMTIDATSNEHIKGLMEMLVGGGKVVADFSGTWLGSTCAAGKEK
jgi:hypothetical protein